MHCRKLYFLLFIFPAVLISGCKNETAKRLELFQLLNPETTNVGFVNQLDYKEEFNIYRYRNFYNGGGVALGDLNNDGLIDIYFTSNMHGNVLYLNKGDFIFEDITGSAGVAGTRAWSTGVSLADVNGDGYLDIYICNSGDIDGDNKQNELFINNQDLTFTEAAEEWRVADMGFSTHGAFFDYDKDGDLDLYLLNNSYQAIGSFNLKDNQRLNRDSLGGDKLYRNEGGHFTDVSVEAGILGSVIGFGLGVTVGDINQDGWFDIYVSNDFFEKDYIYINNQDGTFSERLEEMMRSTSAASMGADMADITNDGHPEIFVTDMLPEHDDRLKTKTTFDNWDSYKNYVDNDYYHQFTRNMLHLNNGDGTFSEIGRLAGVYATDWSWGALIFDMDNDGLKDLFVANGIYQDLTDQDYIQYFSNREVMRSIVIGNNVDWKRLIAAIPSVKIPSYAYKNMGKYSFENKAEEWGLAQPSHSNGSAYGDLDNDGDLDLVVNNVNVPAFIYRNMSREVHPDQHYVKFHLIGEKENRFAIGTRIKIISEEDVKYIEQMPMRGFQSTVDHRPHLGLGEMDRLDSVVVAWPDGRYTILNDVHVDTTVTLRQSEAKFITLPEKENTNPLFRELNPVEILDYRHIENYFVDFERDRLRYHMVSTQGPKLADGDINGDGLTDIFIGGAKDSPGGLFIQTNDGRFLQTNLALFDSDKVSEDTDASFFDADNDGDLDLYVASGGFEFPSSSTALIDRLYINDGSGNFSKSEQILPANKFESSSCVRPMDYDNDGVVELFIGIRLVPFHYGVPPGSYLLENDGKGNFTNVADKIAPELKDLGMVTDMTWFDMDDDGDMDMAISGEWMPVTIFINENGKFRNITEDAGLSLSHGWWNCIEKADIDGDGDMDLVAGNHGLNSRFTASPDKPASMYVNDFDQNGTIEQIISTFNGDTAYPLALKHDLVKQIPYLQKKYSKYEYYRNQSVDDIFTPEQIENSIKYEAYHLTTSIILNEGNGKFSLKPLPKELQFSPVYGILIQDLDSDGFIDILAGGNLYYVKPEVGRYDASYGSFLKGDGKGGFHLVKPQISGIHLEDQVRDFLTIQTKMGRLIIVARNDKPVQIFKF